MNVVKRITGFSRDRGKSLVPSTIITLAIVAMLILSGPAQAVAVLISGQDSYTMDRDIEFQLTIELNENDKYVPLTNISLDLTGNVSKRAVFDLNGKRISGNCGIDINPVLAPNSNDFGYGSGYGYDTGTGYGYDFGNGYGYGYGYGGGGGKLSYIYNVSIETTCLSEGSYTVVATLNTDQNVAFHSSPFNFVLKPGNELNADVEIKPETLNLASKGTITAFITSEEFNVKEIIGNTVRITCDGCNRAHAVKWNDADNKFIAKFKTQDLKNLATGDSVKLIVTGKLKNGSMFEGSDTIKVIDQGKKDQKEDDECECDDDHVKEHDDDHDKNVKEHDDDCDKNVKEQKPDKNKNDDNKNTNGGKGKNVIVNKNIININNNTGTVIVNVYNQGSDTEVKNQGNSNNNNKKNDNGNKEVNHGNNNKGNKNKK